MKGIDYFPIDIDRTSWSASEEAITKIRHQVFVEEQKVPVELEIDEFDKSAVHWLAFSQGDNAVATARLLPDGRVGRMAVLKPFRNKGVGSAVIRQIIKYAIRENVPELTLSAQRKAIPFYEGFGFQSEGDFYEDAGIPHKEMRLPLHVHNQRYQQQNRSRLPEDETRLRQPLNDSERFFNAAQQFIPQAHKQIRIFSDHLLPELYDDQQLCDAFMAFVTSKPSAQIQILVRDIEWLSHHTHRLHELGLRLSSHIEFRKLDDEASPLHTEFMLVDKTGILYQQEPNRFVGYCIQYAPLEASELADEFDALWNISWPDPALRRLHI